MEGKVSLMYMAAHSTAVKVPLLKSLTLVSHESKSDQSGKVGLVANHSMLHSFVLSAIMLEDFVTGDMLVRQT